MNTLIINDKSLGVMLWSLFIAVLFVLGGEAEAALQCNDCHGTKSPADYRPLDTQPSDILFRNPSSGGFQGNHRNHMGPSATSATCAKCHPGSDTYTTDHRNGVIKLSSNINNSPRIALYKNSSSSFPQSSAPALGSCNNVNCHFEEPTPAWGVSPLTSPTDCNKCHAAAPQDGHHPGKQVGGRDMHGSYYGTGVNSCGKCHSDHTKDKNIDNVLTPFAHATSVGKRALSVLFETVLGTPGSYSGSYTGNVSYPRYLPSFYSDNPAAKRDGTCTTVYCHSDGRGGSSNVTIDRGVLKWGGTNVSKCYSCHKGRSIDSTYANCTSAYTLALSGWSSSKAACLPDLTMASNGHHRLVGPQWIRKYPCSYCHYDVVDANGNIKDKSKHVNGSKNISFDPKWSIEGRPQGSYSSAANGAGVCKNFYCHSDGTTDPENVRAFAWNRKKTECWDCHGHPTGTCANVGCHDGRTEDGKVWTVKTGWEPGNEWLGALPMYKNEGPGKARANSHARHATSNFTCDSCHAATIIGGNCKTCHKGGAPTGGMSEVSHLSGLYHVNKKKDVVFRTATGSLYIGGTYDYDKKSCSNTKCHKTGADPVWGGSVNSTMTCLNCHGTETGDVDDYGKQNGIMARINTTEWKYSGHGRLSSAGRYPVSKNPAANFPGNPCWYCHDNSVLHNISSNRFRLRTHPQYEKRFEKECVYCHMSGTNDECLSCHRASTESMAPQLSTILSSGAVIATWPNSSSVRSPRPDHTGYTGSCQDTGCHNGDGRIHNTGAGLWNPWLKDDIKNQYIKMGVCLQCHDDDSGNQCNSCHDSVNDPGKYPPEKYRLGFDPKMEGTRYIKPKVARASASHFGNKHWRAYLKDGTWKGGKFCWNCHDPHGDANGVDKKNIFMIHDKVTTVNAEGRQGIPLEQKTVTFTNRRDGNDYVRTSETLVPPLREYDGICNVCHSMNSKHYTKGSADTHNLGRICTGCHEHRFADSHADKKACNSCHKNSKPVPKHIAFGLPVSCIKCHGGIIGERMDIMGQFGAPSHHVQGVPVTNKNCYQCHWEATSAGTINIKYHEGYNYKLYSSVKNAKVDLVMYGAGGVRPTVYKLNSTATVFKATDLRSTTLKTERDAVENITKHCLSCHSDKNNDSTPFDDCKTPRQYAWDRNSIDARYSQTGTTTWGKYVGTAKASQKNMIKAFSAHGKATLNAGGFDPVNGEDGAIANTRAGSYNVQCFDCHNSHGSKVVGVTSSYVTFNGTKNGANLKETQKGKGGYDNNYQATKNTNPASINTYNPGAGLCFDCHLTKNKGTSPFAGSDTSVSSGYKTPWGYLQTFGASEAVKGYFDTFRFDNGSNGFGRTVIKQAPVQGGHNKVSSPLLVPAMQQIDHICTPCHDPHGVSPSMDSATQKYAVPLLKGTWMTSPYKEDQPQAGPMTGWPYQYAYNYPGYKNNVNIDNVTFGNGNSITQDTTQFAGLCLQCHPKSNLTNTATCSDSKYATDYDRCIASGATWSSNAWKTKNRIHEAVKGWKSSNSTSKHQYSCSKCHAPHVTNLPRLMVTNCLDYRHRSSVTSGGLAYSYNRSASQAGSFPSGGVQAGGLGPNTNCHPTGTWPDNSWNSKTPWTR